MERAPPIALFSKLTDSLQTGQTGVCPVPRKVDFRGLIKFSGKEAWILSKERLSGFHHFVVRQDMPNKMLESVFRLYCGELYLEISQHRQRNGSSD
jgi:hypothetical protein